MNIHPNNIPHLYEDVEISLTGFSKGKIVGSASYVATSDDFDNKKLSDTLVLVRLYSAPRTDDGVSITVVPLKRKRIKILDCTCGHSKEGFLP